MCIFCCNGNNGSLFYDKKGIPSRITWSGLNTLSNAVSRDRTLCVPPIKMHYRSYRVASTNISDDWLDLLGFKRLRHSTPWSSLTYDSEYLPLIVRCLDDDDLSRRIGITAMRAHGLENEINKLIKSIYTNAELIYFNKGFLRLGSKSTNKTCEFQSKNADIGSYIVHTKDIDNLLGKWAIFHCRIPMTDTEVLPETTAMTDYYVLLWEHVEPGCSVGYFVMSYSKNLASFWSQPVPGFWARTIQWEYENVIYDIVLICQSIKIQYKSEFPPDLLDVLTQIYLNVTLYRQVDSYVENRIAQNFRSFWDSESEKRKREQEIRLDRKNWLKRRKQQ